MFIVIVVAFFALCVGYVRLCDRIIGPDSPGREPADVTTRRRARGGRSVSVLFASQAVDNYVGLALAVCLLVLLVAVLVFPERF